MAEQHTIKALSKRRDKLTTDIYLNKDMTKEQKSRNLGSIKALHGAIHHLREIDKHENKVPTRRIREYLQRCRQGASVGSIASACDIRIKELIPMLRTLTASKSLYEKKHVYPISASLSKERTHYYAFDPSTVDDQMRSLHKESSK